MSDKNFIKNLTSKDIELSKNTINQIINSKDNSLFKLLCDNSEYIFPFLKNRICTDFVKLIKKENLDNIFEFSKIYCCDFEDIIVNSWLKFADMDLTDRILELFDNGTKEQKAYCAKYFSNVLDTVSLDELKKYAKSEFLPLKTNCAFALSKFKDGTILDEMKEIVSNSKDDFEILGAFEFIIAYQDINEIKFVLEHAFKNPFCPNIISNLLDLYDFESLKNILSDNQIERIFDVTIDSYPETYDLNTVKYWQIQEYIKFLYNKKTSYSKNLLLLAKNKFAEFNGNDIYCFDLDKASKEEIKNINELLNSFELDLNIDFDINKPFEFNAFLNVTREYRLIQNTQKIADMVNQNKFNQELSIKSIEILKDLNSVELVDKKIVNNFYDINTKAIIGNLVGL